MTREEQSPVVRPVLPFGLAVAAREPLSSEHIDLSVLVYDQHRQITLVRGAGGSLSPWFKHTDGQTTTDSQTDGAGGRETDTDWRED